MTQAPKALQGADRLRGEIPHTCGTTGVETVLL